MTYRQQSFLSVAITAVVCFVVGVFVAPSGSVHKTDYHVERPAPPPPPKPHEEGDPESVPAGWIRSINWEKHTFVYESTDGYQKNFSPVCYHSDDPVAVWIGEGVSQINFRWIRWDQDNHGTGCYVIDSLVHAANLDLHMK